MTAPNPARPDPRLRGQALHAFCAAHRAQPFAWGSNDCALFASDWVLAATGTDPAAAFRGYRTAQEAARLVSEHGGLAAIATAALGPPIRAMYAITGDIVLVDLDGRETLGVCNGQTVLGPGPDGLAVGTIDLALQAWKVA